MHGIQDLVAAVTFIHSEINGVIGCHHDIKPSNIVLFQGPPMIWKLGGFRSAVLKHRDDDSNTTPEESRVSRTYMYMPPEDNQPNKHGRACDIYSLGCVLLELATIWEYGWDGAKLEKFRDLRRDNKKRLRVSRMGGYDSSYHNNPNVVQEWLRDLRLSQIISKDVETEISTSGNQLKAADENIYQGCFRLLLDLIVEMMKEKAQRVFIWEVNMDLYEMKGDKTREELSHHFRNIVQPPRRTIIGLNDTHNPLKRALDRGKMWQVPILIENGWSIEAPQVDEGFDVSDLESVLSIKAPLSLVSGTTLAGIFKTAAEQFADILLEDSSLRPSFEAVVQKAGYEKLKRNLFRLLRKYALCLKIEASSAVETDAARMVNFQANHIVYLVMGSLQNKTPIELPQVMAVKEEREIVLERFLEGQINQGEHSQLEVPLTAGEYRETFPTSPSESNSGEDDVVSEPERLNSFNLKGLERFMIESRAYEQLIKDFLSFANPVEQGNNQPVKPEEPAIVALHRLHWICVGQLFHFVF